MAIRHVCLPRTKRLRTKRPRKKKREEGFPWKLQAALVEAQRRLETNPDDPAAARQPLVAFVAAPPAAMPGEANPIPLVMFQMLGQLWYADTKAKNNVEEVTENF